LLGWQYCHLHCLWTHWLSRTTNSRL